jgi:hypothetical protein
MTEPDKDGGDGCAIAFCVLSICAVLILIVREIVRIEDFIHMPTTQRVLGAP